MSEIMKEKFKFECTCFLSTYTIHPLRAFGRHVGIAQPTTMDKDPLIEKTVKILVGEIPKEKRSNAGAPVKNSRVDPEIINTVEGLRAKYLRETAAPINSFTETYGDVLLKKRGKLYIELNDPAQVSEMEKLKKPILRGQLQTVNGYAMLLPLDCIDNEQKILMPVEFIRAHDLREGDVVSCRVDKGNNAYVACEVLTVNEISVENLRRCDFEESEVVESKEKIRFSDDGLNAPISAKYLDWLLPVYLGQRGLIVSAPKAGKTRLIYEMVKTAVNSKTQAQVFLLLNAQSLEFIGQFRKSFGDRLVYTTYDDDPDRQVFAADYLLKRAKRYAECGRKVLLFVDSFNALARSFNDTEASSGGKMLACGLESKTLQYVKRYFGAAHSLKGGGSLTIYGTISKDTGNPADDLIAADLLALAQHELHLDENLALRRVYPAIDLFKSRTVTDAWMDDSKNEDLRWVICDKYLPRFGEAGLRRMLSESDSFETFSQKIHAVLTDK